MVHINFGTSLTRYNLSYSKRPNVSGEITFCQPLLLWSRKINRHKKALTDLTCSINLSQNVKNVHTNKVKAAYSSYQKHKAFCSLLLGAAAPSGPRATVACFYITHNDATKSVALLWTSDQLVAETSTCRQ